MMELWLACEGEDDSVDVVVLKPIMNAVLASDIVVEPSGSNNSTAVVARFIEKHRGGRAANIIDRDYESRARAEATFADGKSEFMWRRHSIENYLVVPQIIIHAFQRLRERFERQQKGHLPSWVAALPADVNQVTDALRECARRRAAEEAYRLSIHRLWEDISESVGRVQKRTPPASCESNLADPGVWREILHLEGTRLREAGERTAKEPNLEAIAINARYEKHYSEVTSINYIENLEFLIDFHGRDLLREFRHWLEPKGIHFRYESLEKELAATMVEVYTNNRTIHGTDDFLQLANGVRALAGLPPVN